MGNAHTARSAPCRPELDDIEFAFLELGDRLSLDEFRDHDLGRGISHREFSGSGPYQRQTQKRDHHRHCSLQHPAVSFPFAATRLANAASSTGLPSLCFQPQPEAMGDSLDIKALHSSLYSL